jgi:hypothetical protein
MAAQFTNITLSEMDHFLTQPSFKMEPITLPDVREAVYARTEEVGGRVYQLRVYTGIEGTESREAGEDAIRVVLFVKREGTVPGIIGKTTRVHRMANWRKHLSERLASWTELLPCRTCKKCQSPMREIKKPKYHFFGCTNFPRCRYTEEVNQKPAVSPVAPVVVRPTLTPVAAPQAVQQVNASYKMPSLQARLYGAV